MGRPTLAAADPSPPGRRQKDGPFIVTALLDDGAFEWFEALRRAHYPPGRNRVPAHLTLFHALPSDEGPAIAGVFEDACRRSTPMRLQVRGPWSLGLGVAYRVSGAELEALRGDLAAAFDPWLRAQDRAPFRPHITIQNKAEPAEARRLLEQLQLEFEPFEIWAEGLLVWRYVGGPWLPVARIPFGGS